MAELALLADAEAREDAAEQIVRREFARDFAEGLLSNAQFFGDELVPPISSRNQRSASRSYSTIGSLTEVWQPSPLGASEENVVGPASLVPVLS